jgi:hypothetical protein
VVRVRIIREKKWDSPVLNLSDADKTRLGKLVLGDVLNNIKEQKQADGSRLEPNKPGTIARKQAEGKRPLSLVDEEHRFVKPANWDCTWEDATLTVEPGDRGGPPTLRELVEHVQTPPHQYTGWFGITREGLEAVRETLKQILKSAIQRANRRG